MNTKLIAALIVGIVVVVSVAVIAFGTDIFAEPFWKTETTFGEWQEGITIGYKDGTTQELKLVQDNEGSWSPLTVKYGGQEITWVSYYVKAKVTDLGGYDSIKVDAGGLGTTWTTYDAPYAFILHDRGTVAGYGIKTVYLNTPYTILNCQLELDPLIMGDYYVGDYFVSFIPNGNCQYWGYPGGEGDKEYVALPSGKQITVTVSSDGNGGQIIIILESDIETG